MIKIGLRIARFRKSKGYTQEQFAKKIGVSKPSLAKFEKGEIENMPLQVAVNIAQELDVAFGDLFEIPGFGDSHHEQEATIKVLQDSEKYLEKQVKDLEKEVGYLTETNKRLKNENRFLYVEKISFEFRYHLFTLYRNKFLLKDGEVDNDKRETIIKTVYEILARRVKEITEENIIYRKELLHIIYINDAFADYFLDKKADFSKEYTQHLKNFIDTDEDEIEKFLIWYEAVSSRSG